MTLIGRMTDWLREMGRRQERNRQRMNKESFDIAAHLLEHTLQPTVAHELKDVCTGMWHPHTRANASPRAINDVVFRRHDNTVTYAVPWISRHIDLSATHIIDFGCGCGSSSLALGHFAERVIGLEIDPQYVRAFEERMRIMRAANCRCVQTSPEDILAAMEGCCDVRSSIVFLAVIEHLTEAEQVSYLRKAWQLLAPGQVLVILETPNRLSLFDDHTFEQSFAHIVPDEIFIDWIKSSGPETRFHGVLTELADAGNAADVLLRRRRLGVGVAPHVFAVALEEPLEEIVVADAFDEHLINWFPPTKCDELLLEYWAHYDPALPIGFARSVLGFIFKKPGSAKDRESARARNAAHRQRVIGSRETRAANGNAAAEAALRAAERLALDRWDIMQRMEQMIQDRDAAIRAQEILLQERWAWIQKLEALLEEAS